MSFQTEHVVSLHQNFINLFNALLFHINKRALNYLGLHVIYIQRIPYVA